MARHDTRRRDGTDAQGDGAADLRGAVLLLLVPEEVDWAAARHVPHASPPRWCCCRSRGMISIRAMPSNDTMRQSMDPSRSYRATFSADLLSLVSERLLLTLG